MDFNSILLLIIAVASISFKPGPGMAAIVARALEYGFLSAFLVSMGAIVIEVFYFVLAYFGFAFIETYQTSFSIVLKLLGSAYLLYLAYKTFEKAKDKVNINFANDNTEKTSNYLKDFFIGVTVTLANPLVILFYTALIPTVLDLSHIDVQGLLIAVAVIFSVHFVILTSQCALATQARKTLEDKLTVQKFNYISGFLLMGVALYILYSLKTPLLELF